MQRRTVKSFDFDERKSGNVEDVPMYWRRHLAEGFPHYLEGRFDHEVGHESPPSFYLGLNGGSLGYVYRGDDIPVHVPSDYLVSIWVRPYRLRHARVYATAFYCDRNGRMLPETERCSRHVGGADGTDDWQHLTIEMPGGNEKARQLGIGLWVTQSPVWSGSVPGPDEVYRQDIRAGAWFDDIHVVRLPRVSLTTPEEANVFSHGQVPLLRAEVTDPDGNALRSNLEVSSADGRVILDTPVRATTRRPTTAEVIRLGELPPGLYRARLSVWTDKLLLSEQHVSFVRLGPSLKSAEARNTGFGLVLGAEDAGHAGAVVRMVKLLGMPGVKLSLDAAQRGESNGPRTDLETLGLLEGLWRAQTHVVGVFKDPPVGQDGPYDHRCSTWGRFLQAFAREPEVWRPHLVGPFVRYGDFVQGWQLGADEDDRPAWDRPPGPPLEPLRKELARIAAPSVIVMPWPILYETSGNLPNADQLALHVPAGVRADQIPSYVRRFTPERTAVPSVIIQPLESERYDRLRRLGDLAKRLVWSQTCGVETVYLPRPWRVAPAAGKGQIEPREDLIVFRTAAELLSGSRYIGGLYLDETIQCLLFDRQGDATAVLWDEWAPPGGRVAHPFLEPPAEQVDLWGQVTPVPRVDGHYRVRLTPTPVFLRGMKTWHLALQASFCMTPPTIESSYRLHERQVRFTNTYGKPINGLLRFEPPPGWEVRPSRIPFCLEPGQEFSARVTLQFGPSEVAGPKVLIARWTLEGSEAQELTARTPFRLGLEDLELDSVARWEHGKVVVHQRLSSRADRSLDIEGYVWLPGRPRLVHAYRDVKPGQTVQKRFVLDASHELLGKEVRVGLREVNGPRLLNQTVLVQ